MPHQRDEKLARSMWCVTCPNVVGGLAANASCGAYGTGQRAVRPTGRMTVCGEHILGLPASQKRVRLARPRPWKRTMCCTTA